MKKRNAYPVYLLLSGGTSLLMALIFTVNLVYQVTVVHLNPLQLVLVGTTLEAACFLFEIPTGIVADAYSRRLSVIIGTFLIGLGFLVEGCFRVFGTVLLSQVIWGIGYTFTSGATDAWLADEIGEENVGPVYQRSGQVSRITGLVGTVFSVGLASLRLNLPIVLAGSLYIALAVLLILVMPETRFTPTPRGERAHWQTMAQTFREGLRSVRGRPVLLMLIGVGIFAGAASEGFDRLNNAHLLQNFTFPMQGAWKPVVWFGILSVASNLISLALTHRYQSRLDAASRRPAATVRALLAFQLLIIACVLVFALTGSFTLAFSALLVKAVVGSLIGPLYSAWLIQNVPATSRATVLSMISQTDALGQIAAGPAVGAIGKLFSLRAALLTSAFLLSPTLLLYARALNHAREEEILPEPA